MKEFKKYGLSSATRSKASPMLATVVTVFQYGAHYGHAYIRFTDDFIRAVGKKMPTGLSPDDSAYLRVDFLGAHWTISACYLNYSLERQMLTPLWASVKKPAWLRIIKPRKKADARAN